MQMQMQCTTLTLTLTLTTLTLPWIDRVMFMAIAASDKSVESSRPSQRDPFNSHGPRISCSP